MSNNNSEEEEVDRLSELPEPLRLQIISLLPFKFAVRTSILARRFRHLYKSTSSVDLDHAKFPSDSLFNAVTSRYLRLRDPSAALQSFSLKLWIVPTDLVKTWLHRVSSLGVQHLSLHLRADTIETILPFVLGFQSLQTLVIHDVNLDYCFPGYKYPPLVPPSFSQTQMKYLSIRAKISRSDLRLLVSGLSNLEYLSVRASCLNEVDMSSLSVKTLKIIPDDYRTPYRKVSLDFPNLEILDMSMEFGMGLKQQLHVNMPVLKSATVKIQSLYEEAEHVPVLCDILRALSNVSELTLDIGILHPKNEDNLFHPLVEPGKDVVFFPNLRSLRLSTCFYKNALQDLISLLRHSPVIDSLHLIHVDRPVFSNDPWAPEVWHSKLPQNSEGNRKYGDFTNLMAGDKKTEAIKLLSSEIPSKKLKMR